MPWHESGNGNKWWQWSGSRHQHTLAEKKKPSSLKNVLDEAVKVNTFIMAQPLSTCLFHLCSMSKYSGCLQEKHLT